MTVRRGIVIVAIREQWRKYAVAAVRSIHAQCDLPVTVIGDAAVPGADWIKSDGPLSVASAPCNAVETPYDQTLLMDADTAMVAPDAIEPFELLGDYDVALCHAAGRHVMYRGQSQHGSPADAAMKCKVFPGLFPKLPLCYPQFSSGVMFVRGRELFSDWKVSYELDANAHEKVHRGNLARTNDQASLARMLYRSPKYRVATLPPEWNYVLNSPPYIQHPGMIRVAHGRMLAKMVDEDGRIERKAMNRLFWKR